MLQECTIRKLKACYYNNKQTQVLRIKLKHYKMVQLNILILQFNEI